MPLRSKRAKTQDIGRVKTAAEDATPPISDSEFEPGSGGESSKPVASRRVRRARDGQKEAHGKQARGKRGILQRMPDMPLDVLLEVRVQVLCLQRNQDCLTRWLPDSLALASDGFVDSSKDHKKFPLVSHGALRLSVLESRKAQC